MTKKFFYECAQSIVTPLWAPLVLAFITLLFVLFFLERQLENLWLNSLSLESIYVSDSSYAAGMAASFKKTDAKINTIVMVGGSVTRESTLYDDKVEKLFHEKYGKSIRFLNLGSSDQSLLESAALLKTLKLAPGSIVFIQLSFKKLDTSFAKMREEFLRPNMAMLDYSVLNPVFGYSDVFVHSITPSLILNRNAIHKLESEKHCSHIDLFDAVSKCYGKRTVIRHGYSEQNRLNMIAKEKYVNEIKNVVVPNYLLNRDYCVFILNKISSYLKTIDVTPVFIEFPVSDVEKPLDLDVRKIMGYPETIAKLINGEKYLDWAFDGEFYENDFYDSQHLIDSGRVKLTAKLLAFINENINSEKPK